jgi:hypothetical protein
MKRSRCGSCQAPVIGALTVNGKFMPVDVEPVSDGNLILIATDPIPHVTVIKAGQTVDVPRYVSHFATCPHAAQHRRKR